MINAAEIFQTLDLHLRVVMDPKILMPVVFGILWDTLDSSCLWKCFKIFEEKVKKDSKIKVNINIYVYAQPT